MSHKDQWDGQGFLDALNRAVQARGCTWKQVSKDTGIGQSTLSRMKNGRKPDAASLAALSAWSGLNPATFMAAPKPIEKPPKFSPDALASAIREMVKADIQGDGERYTIHETAMRQQLCALYGQSALQAKEAEIAALKVKADRYDWLRQYPNNLDGRVYGPTYSKEGGGLLKRDEYLDAAIDSARAAGDGEEKR
jgi:transcriptional regulator with XRE-family HTH domain